MCVCVCVVDVDGKKLIDSRGVKMDAVSRVPASIHHDSNRSRTDYHCEPGTSGTAITTAGDGYQEDGEAVDQEKATGEGHNETAASPASSTVGTGTRNEKNKSPQRRSSSTAADVKGSSDVAESGINGGGDDHGDDAGMQQVVSNMFGRSRQATAEERTRHAGVVWKNLTVRGVGVGATLQSTISDIFLALPRLLWGAATRICRRRKRGDAVRTILDDFTVCLIIRFCYSHESAGKNNLLHSGR